LTKAESFGYALHLNLNMRTATREVKRRTTQRKNALKTSGHTYDDLARLAGVSWRMVKFWIDGERTSAKIAKAFTTLTGESDSIDRQPLSIPSGRA
jgi:hypothetical protein